MIPIATDRMTDTGELKDYIPETDQMIKVEELKDRIAEFVYPLIRIWFKDQSNDRDSSEMQKAAGRLVFEYLRPLRKRLSKEEMLEYLKEIQQTIIRGSIIGYLDDIEYSLGKKSEKPLTSEEMREKLGI